MDFQPLPTIRRTSDNIPCIFVARGTLYTSSETEIWTLLSTLSSIERNGPAPKSTLDAEEAIIRSLRDDANLDPEVEVGETSAIGILTVEEYSKRAFRAVFEYTPGVDTKGIMSLKSLSIPFHLPVDATPIHQPTSGQITVFEHVTDLHIHFTRVGGVPQTFQETLTSLDQHLHSSVLFPRVTTLSLTGSFSHGDRPLVTIARDVDIQQLEFAPKVAGQVLVEQSVSAS